jgi:Putative Flp pilus-assembly TadE/G-like/D-alanyl-D-alanine carboxypeptidase
MGVDTHGHGCDRGQATPLAAAILAIVTVALVALVPAGRALADRARARTAADAAALAGAADGEQAARDLATANGGELVAFDRAGDEVVVRVRVGDVDAYARAQATRRAARAPALSPEGGGDRAGLAATMLAALARADGLLGHPVPVVSGLRTRAEQEALWQRRHTNPYPVARPGTSDHERGLAVDVPRSHVADLLVVAPAAGLCQPLPATDPVHFVVCGT